MTSNNLRIAPVVLAVLAAVLTPVAAEATISRAFSFDEKVEHAASIFVGKCVRQEARWDDSKRWILTYSTFSVEKMLKGTNPLRELTVVTPGGKVDGLQQDTIGVPHFDVGDERVLFVRNTEAGPTVLYFDQGAYTVVREGNERVVRPVASEAVYVNVKDGSSITSDERPRTLRDFEGAVRDSIRRREAIRMKMIEEKRQKEASLGSVLSRNKSLVALALLGVMLATWRILKR
jgi:hypothetical protein